MWKQKKIWSKQCLIELLVCGKKREKVKEKVVIFIFCQFMISVMICISFLSKNENDLETLNSNIQLYDKLRHKIGYLIKWLYGTLLTPYMGIYIYQ